jgi:hypothetical protein
MSDIDNSRFAAVDGGTGGDGVGRPGNGDNPWLTMVERLQRRKAAEAERLRMEVLVSQVTAQLLVRPIPMTNTGDLYAWATDRARNILAGLAGERL